MIYFQAKPKTAVPGDSSTQLFPAPDEAFHAKVEEAVAKRIPQPRIQFLGMFPAGVPITILASTEVC